MVLNLMRSSRNMNSSSGPATHGGSTVLSTPKLTTVTSPQQKPIAPSSAHPVGKQSRLPPAPASSHSAAHGTSHGTSHGASHGTSHSTPHGAPHSTPTSAPHSAPNSTHSASHLAQAPNTPQSTANSNHELRSTHAPTSRRIWIKRAGGTPTTIIISKHDIIDDLKLEAVRKFPNTLGRLFDASDLIIKMDLLARLASNNVKKTTRNPGSTGLISPEPVRATNTPRVINSNANGVGYSLINLEADQNVWSLVDNFYPNGISMNEAFIIEAPGSVDELYSQLTVLQHGARESFDLGNSQQQTRQTTQPLPLNTLMLVTNLKNSPTPTYFQPKPQNYYVNSALAPVGSTDFDSLKDRSISPGTAASRLSPMLHRRAHSNPPQSPTTLTSSSSSYGYTPASTTSTNPNLAVLLLPKNFSMSQDSSSGYTEKKRYSFDDSYSRKQRSNSLSNTKINSNNSALGANLTNIGMGISSPTSSNHSVSHNSIPENENDSNVDMSPVEITSPIDKENEVTRENIDKKVSHSKTPKPLPTIPTPVPTTNKIKLAKSLDENVKEKPRSGTASLVKQKGKDHNNTKATPSPTSNRLSVKPATKSTTERVLPSISVLVVEDNAINQAILGAFLRRHKIHYQIAKNGQEAIDKWREGGFHLVLMDIQLPVKSGIEATKEIRHLEKINKIGVFAENELMNSHYSNFPELKDDEILDLNVFRSPVIIVALTASSDTSDDKKKALTAGCNDYLTKPVNLVWLQNKITEWGCMQALIDFDGWNTKKQATGKSSPNIPASRGDKNGGAYPSIGAPNKKQAISAPPPSGEVKTSRKETRN